MANERSTNPATPDSATPQGQGYRWQTWGHRHASEPTQVFAPRNAAEVQRLVAEAAAAGSQLKVVGASRSSSAIAQPTDRMLSLANLVGATEVNATAGTATFWAGTTVQHANKILASYGLAFENLGRLGQQTLAGAVSTGTHGTGLGYGIFSTQVLSLQLVTSTGDLIECSETHNEEIFRAALVGLGALGVIVSLTFRVVPMFRVHAVERGHQLKTIVHSFAERSAGADHYEFAWYPGSHTVRTRRLTRLPLLTEGYMPSSARISQARRYGRDYALSNGLFEAASLVGSKWPAAQATVNKVANFARTNRRYADLAPAVFVVDRRVQQNTMEYAFDLADFEAVMGEVQRTLETADAHPSFPLVVTTSAADDLSLSPAFGRPTVYISAREYWRNDAAHFFDALESVFTAHGGRPHWGQEHSLKAADLARLYPGFSSFAELREEMDPEGVFLNPYLRRVLMR